MSFSAVSTGAATEGTRLDGHEARTLVRTVGLGPGDGVTAKDKARLEHIP